MKITWSTTSQQGERDSNEDVTGAHLNNNAGCFLVCDGVAGNAGGDVAAQLVRDTLLNELTDRHPLTALETRLVIEKADQLLRTQQQTSPALARMSTTLAALFIDRERLLAWWAHAGDSRLYHFRRGYIHEVTRDHSLVQQLRDAGMEHTGINSNLLLNALGAQPPREASYSEMMPLEDGDAFLLCTDGFWQTLTAEEMEQSLHMVNSPKEWLALMQMAINRREKRDNLSAVAVWVGAPQDITLLHSLADTARFIPPHD
ncbi:serine/threonine phosphatase [Enterobacterales bacterium CwR94]|nr:serine/threonine phosphatase [Enterobacterales bacterium CwR94]